MAANELQNVQTTSLQLSPPMTEAVKKLDICAQDLEVVANQPPSFHQNMLLAMAIDTMRKALFQKVHEGRALIDYILLLQGTPLGFAADKTYTAKQCSDIVIQAASNGARMVGKEVTALSGQAYLNQEFFTRMVDELQDQGAFSMDQPLEYVIQGDGPMPGTKTVTVHYRFHLNGQAEDRTRTVYVKVNSGMGPDAVLGKAKRKALKWLYEYVTGRKIQDVAEDVPDMEAREVPRSPLEAPQDVQEAILDPQPPTGTDQDVDATEADSGPQDHHPDLEPVEDAEEAQLIPPTFQEVMDGILAKVDRKGVEAFLIGHMNWLKKGQHYEDLPQHQQQMIMDRPDAFAEKAAAWGESQNG